MTTEPPFQPRAAPLGGTCLVFRVSPSSPNFATGLIYKPHKTFRLPVASHFLPSRQLHGKAARSQEAGGSWQVLGQCFTQKKILSESELLFTKPNWIFGRMTQKILDMYLKQVCLFERHTLLRYSKVTWPLVIAITNPLWKSKALSPWPYSKYFMKLLLMWQNIMTGSNFGRKAGFFLFCFVCITYPESWSIEGSQGRNWNWVRT